MKRIVLLGSSLLVAVAMVGMFVAPAVADLSPETVNVTLDPGQCTEVAKLVDIDALPPAADVLFAFDLTGSMGGILATAKSRATDIMNDLAATGVDIQFGVVSYMDYPDTYSFCGYTAQYGHAASGDYSYSMDQAITSNTGAVQTAINGLVLGHGVDGPEAYTRALYESWADTSIGWRAGAKRVLVNFGDNIPHDCQVNEGVPGWGFDTSTGIDPGRDEIAGTADDIDLQDDALAGMVSNNIKLLACQTGGEYWDHWGYWAGLTGGGVYNTSAADMVDQVVAAVTEGLEEETVTGLHLEVVDPGNTDGTWATFDPASYGELTLPVQDVAFTETLCVPAGTDPDTYSFTVAAVDDAGVYYGEELVTITVPGEEPPPAIPGVTQWGIIAMVTAFSTLGLFTLRRRYAIQ